MGLMDLLTGAVTSVKDFATQPLTEEQRQALLAASFSLMMPARSNAEAFGRAGMFGLQRYDQAQENTRRNDVMKTEAEQRRLQIEQLKRALEEAQRRRAIASSVFGGGAMPSRDPYEDAGAPQGGSPMPTPQPGPAAPQGPILGEAPGWRQRPMSGPAPARSNEGAAFNALLERAVRAFTASGDTAEAEKYQKILNGLEGKAHGEVKVDKDGKPFYMTDRGPRYTEGGGFVPKSKISWHDAGNRLVPTTEFGEIPGGIAAIAKSLTPEQAWNREKELRYGAIHEGYDENGNKAVFRIPLGGAAVKVPGMGSEKKTLTMGESEKLLTLDQLAAQASVAREAVRKNPRAVGPENRLIPDWVLNSMSPTASIDTRAKLADISTQILNARSGAAVTEHEFKRLSPFLATPTDTAESAKTKLKNLEQELRSQAQARRAFYASQGFKIPASTMDAAFAAPQSSSAMNLTGIPGNMSAAQLAAAIEKSLREGN